MLSLSHTLISLPFAFYFQNPVLIFLAAFAFHFFLDTLLHWNIYPQNFKRFPFLLVGLDVIVGLLISWLMLGETMWTLPVLAAIAGGNGPDILHTLWIFIPKKIRSSYGFWLEPAFTWHDHLQFETTNLLHGLFSQVFVIGIAIILLSIA